MKKIKYTLLFFIIPVLSAVAQDSLKLEQAIEIILKNNYSIGIARTQANIARNNNNIGNAGFLPSLSLNSSPSVTSANTEYDFNQSVRPGPASKGQSLNKNLNANVALNWTIFNGFYMFATKEKLSELEAQGLINLKIAIENTMLQTISGYYNIVRQQELIKASKEAIRIYDERKKIAQLKFDVGSIAKTELLQAKVDLNAQMSLLLQQNTALDSSKASLNQLLSRNVDYDFIAVDSTVVSYQPVYEDLEKHLETKNNQILYAQKNIKVAEKNLKQMNSYLFPQLSINTGYNFNQNKYQVGIYTLSRLVGPSAGFTASWTLFNGFIYHTQIKAAQYAVEQNTLQYKLTASLQQASLLKMFKTYQNALVALKLEQENTLVAKENQDIALERFRVGTTGSIELMLAQKSYIDALGRLISARYNAKISETQIMKLEGSLVK